jgi:isopentenyldiphosphate isomerase
MSSAPDLAGYLARVQECNTQPEELHAFVPFTVDGAAVGLLRPAFAALLAGFPDVFHTHGGAVALLPGLATPAARTDAVARCMRQLADAGHVSGWRDELFPVAVSFDSQPAFLLERACAAHFGIKAYGVHVNCFSRLPDGRVEVWVARRSRDKPTWPLLLDHAVAGGLPHGLSPSANVVKECEEEANVPADLAARAQPVGVVSYTALVREGVKRDVLFCYDLELPTSFTPSNNDGEVEEFMRWPLERVAETVRTTREYKPNCCIVIVDFLVRHGYVRPESSGYLQLLAALRSGDIS